MTPFEKVKMLLDEAGVKYDIFEHDPIVTVEEADKVLGRPQEQGVKALLLKSADKFILCAVKGSHKIDYGKVRALLESRKLRFATPEEVVDTMGVEVGACYPFGQVAEVDMLVDQTLESNDYIVFSPGVHDKHIGMKWSDYKKVVDPKLADITK